MIDGAGLPTATEPGRGLERDRITSPCHYGFTAEDVRLFSLMQRLLRVDLRTPSGAMAPSVAGAAVALYRGTAPGRLRADLFPRPSGGGAATCRLALAVDLERTEAGSSARALLREIDPVGEGLHRCSPDQVSGEAFLPAAFPSRLTLVFEGVEGVGAPVTGTVGLHPPAFTGVEPLGPPAGSVDVETPGDAVTVEWDELVAATAWCSICPADEGTI